MKLQNILDLSTFEITRFRIWNQTSQPSDKGLGSKYFNTNSGHEAYGREQIYTPSGWRTAAYMDDIEAINEKLDLIFGDEIDTDTIIDSWKEVQDFLAGIEDTENLVDLLNSKLDKTGGTLTKENSNPLIIKRTGSGGPGVEFYANNTRLGSLGIGTNYAPFFYNADKGELYTLIHSGNIKDYKAGGLAKSVSIWGQSFDGTENVSGNITIPNNKNIIFKDSADSDVAAVLFNSTNSFSVGYGVALRGYNTSLCGNEVTIKYGIGPTTGMILNSSGNVTIGDSDLALNTYRAYVKGDAYISGVTTSANQIVLAGQTASSSLLRFSRVGASFIMAPEEGTINISVTGFATLASSELRITSGAITRGTGRTVSLGSSQYPWNGVFSTFGEFTSHLNVAGLANLNGGALIPTGKNMMFGDASGNAIMEYDADANAIKVTGNFYATGTVASGGKAQAGTGTGGSAKVYTFSLTYGKAAYQIENPKSDTNVIVQVYEWNATTSSWDLILTDVNVTASKITVTFGRTTTVNHMVTVV